MIDSIKGKTFVLTGKAPAVRATIVEAISAAGGFVAAKVTRGVDFLVVGDIRGESTSKLTEAKNRGVPIASVGDLHTALGSFSPFDQDDISNGTNKTVKPTKEMSEAARRRAQERIDWYANQADAGMF